MKNKLFLICALSSFFISFDIGSSKAQFKAWDEFYGPTDSSFSVGAANNLDIAFVTGKVKSDTSGWDIHTIGYGIFSGNVQGIWIYSTPFDEEPVNIVNGGNNFFYITAKKKNTGNNYDVLLLKYSTNGSLIWQSSYPGPANGDDVPYSTVFNTNDNKIYITASSNGSQNNSDILTIKVDTSGNILWVRSYNYSLIGNSIDVPSEITCNGVAGIYVSGTSDDSNNVSRIVTLGYDTSGVLQFSSRWGNSTLGGSISTAIDHLPNFFLVTGGYFFNGSNYDYIILNYDINGNLQWSKIFNGSANGNDYLSDVKIDNNANVISTGSSYAGAINDFDYATIKYLPNGDSGWVNTLNGTSSGKDSAVALVIDGMSCSFVTGKSLSTNGKFAYGSVLYNTAGFFHWIRYYQNPNLIGDNVPSSIAKFFFSNSFLITGSTLSNLQNTYTTIMYGGVIDGVRMISYNKPDKFRLHQNYPNPFNPSTVIRFEIPVPQSGIKGQTSNVTMIVYDVLGNEIVKLVDKNLNPGSYEYKWNSENIAAGVYFYRLSYGQNIETKKMILLK